MAGNAHRNRHRSRPCATDCMYCKGRPSVLGYSNKNGHRRNPARGKRQRKRKLNLNV